MTDVPQMVSCKMCEVPEINSENELEEYLKKVLPLELQHTSGKWRTYCFPFNCKKGPISKSSIFLNFQNQNGDDIQILSRKLTELFWTIVPQQQIKQGKDWIVVDDKGTQVSFHCLSKMKNKALRNEWFEDYWVEITMTADWQSK